ATETDESVSLDRINVTGSRIKRSELEGPSPVYVIDQDMMAERGYVTVYEALNGLAVNNGLVVEGPESQLFTPDVQTINLRSFGVGQTLTLINGRRLTNYPAAYQSDTSVFNYGAIPTAAVERIEVLATAASAIYGSDAVSGVVNIVLRKDIDANTLNVLWGTPTETKNSKNDTRIQFMHGKTFDRGNYTLSLEYSKRDGLRGGDYKNYDEETDYPYQNINPAIPNRQIYYVNVWNEYFGFDPWYYDPRDAGGCPGPDGVLTLEYRDPHGYFCGHNGVQDYAFRNEKEAISAYFNGNLEIGDNGTELFTDLLYYSSETSSHYGAKYIFEEIINPYALDPYWNYYYDADFLQRGFTSEELGMNLDEQYEDDALTFVLGARGTFRDFHEWEASYTYSNYEFKSALPWFKWREVIDDMLGQNVGLSPFGRQFWCGGRCGEDLAFPWATSGFADVTDTVRNAIGMHTYGNESTDHFFSFQMSGDLFEMNAGPLSYAFVVEYQDTDFNYVPDEGIGNDAPDTDYWGDPILAPLVGSDWYKLTGYTGGGDRQRYAIGGELRIPILNSLTLNLAGRYDDYDSGSTSFGGDFTPSATLEYRPSTNLLIRAGYTESFRAPDMALVFVDTGSFQGGYDLVQCWQIYNIQNPGNELTAAEFEAGGYTGDCDSDSFFSRRTGAQNLGEGEEPLDAETGSSFWYGFSWDITDDLQFQADFIHQELEGRVETPNVNTLLSDEWECVLGNLPQADCDANALRVVRISDPTTGISFIDQLWRTPYNSSFLEADSLDIRFVYTVDTEIGRFGLTGDYAHILKLNEREVKGGETVNLR
ncbi:MAG: TonB-dependent receptor, partial [Xanthomonadales bacterium]|nr:TonB-dependent receptor [Xanthomonadales bacterium]